MKVYFTGIDLDFIGKVREIVEIQGKTEEVIIIPNKYMEQGVLFWYDSEKQDFVKINNVKEHSF